MCDLSPLKTNARVSLCSVHLEARADHLILQCCFNKSFSIILYHGSRIQQLAHVAIESLLSTLEPLILRFNGRNHIAASYLTHSP